jgi:hypothetical protein
MRYYLTAKHDQGHPGDEQQAHHDATEARLVRLPEQFGTCDKRRQQGCASMQAKLRVSAPRRSQLIGSTLAVHAVRDLPLPTMSEGAILGPTTTSNPGNVGSGPYP